MTSYESVPAVRLEASLKVSVARVGEVIKAWSGRAATLGQEALSMLEEVQQQIIALNLSQKKEGLEAAAAQRTADKAGQQSVELVRQLHAVANAAMWAERAKLAAQGLGEDANTANFALAQWLEGLNPSAFAALSVGDKAKALESINTRKAQVLGADAAAVKLSAALDEAALNVRAADKAQTKEETEAAQASRATSLALNAQLVTTYQAARDVLSGALRLAGQLGELDRLLPSFWDATNPSKRAASLNPKPPEGDAPTT